MTAIANATQEPLLACAKTLTGHGMLPVANRLPKRIRKHLTPLYDHIRLMTLYALSEDINRKDLPGDIAELGVYRGRFARYIGLCFPDRPFHLFDTFEGFAEQDMIREMRRPTANVDLLKTKAGDFRDTSAEKVLKHIGSAKRCVVHKGRFPETAANLMDKRFVFVSLDADLHDPTKAGLEYFYPRMVPGGAIMIHDCRGRAYRGCGEAVEQFCRENGVPSIPVPDRCGSRIVMKA